MGMSGRARLVATGTLPYGYAVIADQTEGITIRMMSQKSARLVSYTPLSGPSFCRVPSLYYQYNLNDS